MALSEIFPKYSFLFVGWLVGCFGVLGCSGVFFGMGNNIFKSQETNSCITLGSCTY